MQCIVNGDPVLQATAEQAGVTVGAPARGCSLNSGLLAILLFLSPSSPTGAQGTLRLCQTRSSLKDVEKNEISWVSLAPGNLHGGLLLSLLPDIAQKLVQISEDFPDRPTVQHYRLYLFRLSCSEVVFLIVEWNKENTAALEICCPLTSKWWPFFERFAVVPRRTITFGSPLSDTSWNTDVKILMRITHSPQLELFTLALQKPIFLERMQVTSSLCSPS